MGRQDKRVMQILFISMHSYITITYLHTNEFDMYAMLLGLNYMINIIHATPRYHLKPTFLATEIYTSLL
jgi:hypothetical protein